MCIDYFDKPSLERWFRDNGDKTHRLNYDLNESSIIFDIGGYEGGWSQDIYDKFNCEVHIYEPMPDFYNRIKDRFNSNDKIHVYNYAISNFNGVVKMNNDEASSSFFNSDGDVEVISKDINDIIDREIDLIKINIEGVEYDLMESITDDKIKMVNNFQIQFHKIGDNTILRRDKIRERLSKTHKITYDYTFVWENWERL
jgi:FkbM family methyltransferase